MIMTEKPKRITFRSKELREFRNQLEKVHSENILAKRKLIDEARGDHLTKIYWPSEKNWLAWSVKSDEYEFYKGIEIFCQYAFDHDSSSVMPSRPIGAPHSSRYRTFTHLSRRWNAGDFRIDFTNVD